MDKFIYFLGIPLFLVFIASALRGVILLFIILPVSHFFLKDKKVVDGIFELFTKAFRVPKIYWMLLFALLSVVYCSYFFGTALYVLIPLAFLSGIVVVNTQWVRPRKKKKRKRK